MTLNLTRRSVKGQPLTAVDHDSNLDKLETGVLARPTTAAQTAAITAAVTAHEAAADPHPQYLTPAEADAAYATAAQGTKADTAIQPGDPALSDARTPTAHKSTHAIGGTDALTPADIGAATAAQGSLASTAVQPGSLATVATSGAYNDLSGRPTLGTAAAASTGDFATAAQGAKADTAVQPGALGNSAGLNVGTTTGTVAAGDDSRITGALSATDAATTYQPLDSDLTAIASLTTTTFGRELLTQADAAATRTTIGAGTSNVAISSATPQPLGTAAAGATGQAADAGHVHASPPLVSTSTAGLQAPTGFGTITYAAQVALDLAVLTGQVNTITLTGALELTTSNLANGRVTGLRLIPGASARDLTFPADWKFVSAKPASLPADKVARLTIECHGTTNVDVVAAIAIQP